MIKELNKNNDDGDEEELFAIKVFNEFNFKKENTNSFTIFIENERSSDWNSVFCNIYGDPKIPNQIESNGRHWCHNEYNVDGIIKKRYR